MRYSEILVGNSQSEPTPPLFVAPTGVTPLTLLEYRRDLWLQKTRVPGLLYGVVCMIVHLAVLMQYRDR